MSQGGADGGTGREAEGRKQGQPRDSHRALLQNWIVPSCSSFFAFFRVPRGQRSRTNWTAESQRRKTIFPSSPSPCPFLFAVAFRVVFPLPSSPCVFPSEVPGEGVTVTRRPSTRRQIPFARLRRWLQARMASTKVPLEEIDLSDRRELIALAYGASVHLSSPRRCPFFYVRTQICRLGF